MACACSHQAFARGHKARATLLVGKLDRLARNVLFITPPMDAKVDFVRLRHAHAKKAMLQIMAAFAEAARISSAPAPIASLAATLTMRCRSNASPPSRARTARRWSRSAVHAKGVLAPLGGD